MYPGVAFLCTENLVQGARSLKQIPLSLRTLFRKTSVQLPDMANLVCCILRVNAFKKPVTMSRNLVKAVETVFKIINMKKYNKASVYKLLIQKATKLLRKNPDAGEGLFFYSVLCEYFEHLLSSQEFSLTKTFLMKTYEIEEGTTSLTPGQESRESPDTNTGQPDVFSELGLTENSAQLKISRQISSTLGLSNSIILVGPAAAGKSSVIELGVAMYERRVRCRKTYININTYRQAQILGDKDNHGIIANILLDCDEQNIFHIDGTFPEGLAFPLSLLVDHNEFMTGSGKKIVPRQPTKFIMEAERLEDICPSFVSRSVIIMVRPGGGEELGLPHLCLESRLRAFSEENREVIRTMFNVLERNRETKDPSPVDTFLYRSKQVVVSEMMDILEAVSSTSTNQNELHNYFVYSYFWAFSSCLPELGKLGKASFGKPL